MLNWLRLMFMTIFKIEDLPVVWDVIISQLPNINVIYKTCLQLLLNVKTTIMQGDSINALNTLFRYPPIKNPCQFIIQVVQSSKSQHQQSDIITAVTERLNDLARGLENLCAEKNLDDFIPYIAELRRSRDILLGVITLNEMLPLDQALILFQPSPVEMSGIPFEEKTAEKVSESLMPKAAS